VSRLQQRVIPDTFQPALASPKLFIFSVPGMGFVVHCVIARKRSNVETFAEILCAAAAVVVTVACGLLLEELVFGGLARLCLVPRPGASEKPTAEK
jgi:hypothetical protein